MCSRYRKAAFGYALWLLLILAPAEALGACNKTYKFMSEVRQQKKVSSVDKVINNFCDITQFEEITLIGWKELSQKIIWPRHTFSDEAGTQISMPVLIVDKDLPAVETLFNLSKKREVTVGFHKCRAYEISIMGKHEQKQEDDIRCPVRAIRLNGSGEALICDENEIPETTSIRLKRTLVPALWSEVGQDFEEEIDIAWTIMP